MEIEYYAGLKTAGNKISEYKVLYIYIYISIKLICKQTLYKNYISI